MIEPTTPTPTPTPEQQIELDDLTNTWVLSNILQLPSNPHIVIAGAYQGKVMQWFLHHYPTSHVTGYEPAEWARDKAYDKLRAYDPRRYCIYPCGLGTHAESNIPMYEWGTDSCTLLKPEATSRPEIGHGDIVETIQELRAHSPIDLLILNMEGYEYYLIPHIYELLPPSSTIGSLAVQFHTAYQPSIAHYASILHHLDNTFPHHFNYFLSSWGYWY